MVRHGCLALAIAMLRVNLSMVVPFTEVRSSWRSARMTESSGRPDVAHLQQQPEQRRLVGHLALEEGGAVLLGGDGQPSNQADHRASR